MALVDPGVALALLDTRRTAPGQAGRQPHPMADYTLRCIIQEHTPSSERRCTWHPADTVAEETRSRLLSAPSLQHLCRRQFRLGLMQGKADLSALDGLPEWVTDYVSYGQPGRMSRLPALGLACRDGGDGAGAADAADRHA